MHRLSIFRDNLNIIRSKKSAHQMGVTEFADLTNAEFQDKMLMPMSMNIPHSKAQVTGPIEEDPEFLDWRLNGTVTNVRASPPWTGAAVTAVVEALEAAYARKHGQLIRLSTQQVVDCMHFWESKTVEGVYNYFMTYAGGIASEADYPEHSPCLCHFDESKSVDKQWGYITFQGGLEGILKLSVKRIPVVAVIDASEPAFQLYKSGIYYSDTCGRNGLNHVVTVVGYGMDKEQGQAYWLVKNSWGKGWGEEGYIRIARNKGNVCGIASAVTYPFLVIE